MNARLQRTCHWLTRPLLLHWLMPYLMVLVAAGTVAQKYIGLYDSQILYFSSCILWAGPVPLPGMRMVVALLLISLLAKLVLASPWRKATSGIFITHLGVLLLLLGGLLTAASSTEGYMALDINETAGSFSDYHQRVLTVSKNDTQVVQIPFPYIARGTVIKDKALPFTISVNASCRNCTMAMRQGNNPAFKGSAQKIELASLDNYLEEERNLAGVEIAVSGTKSKSDGIYVLFEPMEKQPAFTLGKDHYSIRLGREAYPLPFSLQLLEAQKEVHPGTSTPRSFRSVVLLSDGNLHQRAVITMNHPLRYKGYTVYQASFSGGGDAKTQNVSFAVVQNSGRVFPYVASATLCIGLLVHLCFRLPTLIRRKADA